MPRPRLIEREQVAEAALRIVDEQGLDALSLERIARELGVTGPALYNHFKDKDDILREVSIRVLGPRPGEPVGPTDETDFVEWLVRVSRHFFVRATAHPRAALVLLTHLPTDLQDLGFANAAHLMSDAGVPPRTQHLIMEGAQRLVWGWVLQYSDVFARRRRMSRRRKDPLLEQVRAAGLDRLDLVEQSVRSFVGGVLARSNEIEAIGTASARKR